MAKRNAPEAVNTCVQNAFFLFSLDAESETLIFLVLSADHERNTPATINTTMLIHKRSFGEMKPI